MPHMYKFDAMIAQRSQNRPSMAAIDRKQVFDALRSEHARNERAAIDFLFPRRSGRCCFVTRERRPRHLAHDNTREPVTRTTGPCHVPPSSTLRAS